MHDAVQSLSPAARAAYDRGDLADLAFADDTLLMGVCSVHLTEFLDAVAISGNRFGLSLHTDKFQLIQVNCNSPVYLPSGAAVPAEATLGYLGTTLSHDGHINSKLARCLGMARADLHVFN